MFCRSFESFLGKRGYELTVIDDFKKFEAYSAAEQL